MGAFYMADEICGILLLGVGCQLSIWAFLTKLIFFEKQVENDAD